jgi:hypothetical protein
MIECRNQAYIRGAEQSSEWQQGDVRAPDGEDHRNQIPATLVARIRDMLDGRDSFSLCAPPSAGMVVHK